MTWTQPMCDACWTSLHGNREPLRIHELMRATEQCAWCGRVTASGIYVHEDPAAVLYPVVEED